MYSGRRATYSQWQAQTDRMDRLLANEWSVVWPDKVRTFGEPHVPNVPLIAVEDRARLVAAGNPSILCRPENLKESEKRASEKRERILGGYWEGSRVRRTINQWAFDAMVAGLDVCKVLPNFSLPRSERFPIYTRIDPRMCYPSPMFTDGPYVDDMLIAYEESWRTIAKRFDAEVEIVKMLGNDSRSKQEKVTVLEYYDDEVICAVAKYTRSGTNQSTWTWLLEPMKHNLKHAPIVIGVRPTPGGIYHGDFPSVLGALRTWNRMVAMSVDSAIDRVYPMFAHYDVANPQDRGPDADLELETGDARAEFVAPAGEPFSNVQLVKQMADAVRAGALLPPARTGDPNESIISAAGISAANSQMADHVRSLQRDVLAPMLECANELALEVDEKHCNVRKTINGYARGRAYSEDYKPSEDIAGRYRNKVIYGLGAGLDEVNTNQLVLQQLGGGLIAQSTGREQSPFVENPQDEEKKIAMETLHAALLAGIYAQAQQGVLPAQTIAGLMEDFEKPNTSLHDAVARNVIAAPLAPPTAPAGAPPAAAGVAGAEQPTNFQGPPLEELLAGARP